MRHIRILSILIILTIILIIIYYHNSNWTFEYPFLIGILTNFMVLLIAKELKLFDII